MRGAIVDDEKLSNLRQLRPDQRDEATRGYRENYDRGRQVRMNYQDLPCQTGSTHCNEAEIPQNVHL
jgi:hypothetical protein